MYSRFLGKPGMNGELQRNSSAKLCSQLSPRQKPLLPRSPSYFECCQVPIPQNSLVGYQPTGVKAGQAFGSSLRLSAQIRRDLRGLRLATNSSFFPLPSEIPISGFTASQSSFRICRCTEDLHSTALVRRHVMPQRPAPFQTRLGPPLVYS